MAQCRQVGNEGALGWWRGPNRAAEGNQTKEVEECQACQEITGERNRKGRRRCVSCIPSSSCRSSSGSTTKISRGCHVSAMQPRCDYEKDAGGDWSGDVESGRARWEKAGDPTLSASHTGSRSDDHMGHFSCYAASLSRSRRSPANPTSQNSS
jgi:hypothetical protein